MIRIPVFTLSVNTAKIGNLAKYFSAGWLKFVREIGISPLFGTICA